MDVKFSENLYQEMYHISNTLKITLLLGFLITMATSCQEVAGSKSLKLAHGLDVSHPVHEAMVYMAEKVAEKSGGKLKIQVYPSQQLGTERQCLELLQIGSVGIVKVSASVLESFSPDIQVLGVPYVFRSREHHFRVLDGEIGKRLLLGGEKYWLRGLCFYDAGSRSFYTKDRPVNSPADLEGLKIRVQESKTAIDLVNSMGGAATPISFGELYTALQQGVVDGAENNPPSFYTSRHYEVCKYYSLDEHTAVPDVLLIGTIVWNRLNPQEQQWLQEAADESVIYQRELWAKAEQEALDEVQKAGVEIIYPDKKPFAEKVKPMLEGFKDNERIYSLIQEIHAVEDPAENNDNSNNHESEVSQ